MGAVSKFGFAGRGRYPRLRFLPMIFSTDLTKPLSRVGLAINLVLLTALFYVVSAASYYYMTETLPH